MAKNYIIFTLLSIFVSLHGFATSLVSDVCPVELRNLINDSSTTCEEVFPIARPFLDDAAAERLRKSNEFMGDLLIKSIKSDLASIGSLDQIYSSLNVDFGTVESCSLERITSSLPCSGSEQANLEALTRHFPGGALSGISDLVDMISNEYRERVSMDQTSSSNSCINSAWDGSIALESILGSDGDLRTLINYANQSTEDLSNEDRDKYDVLDHEFKKNFPSFYEKLISLNPDSITGSSLREQLSLFVASDENKSMYQQSIGDTCSSMISRISNIVCSPIDNGQINNSDFNNSALNYDAGVFSSGFDDFAVEMSGSDPEEAYGNYILNCTPECVDCDGMTSVDALIESSFDGDIRSIINERHEAEQLIRERARNENFCPLLACENALEVFSGEACNEREAWRSPSEIRTLLNCPEDEMCNEESFISFSQVLETQNSAATSSEVDADGSAPVVQSSGLSSFSRNFLGVEETIAAAVVAGDADDAVVTPVVTNTRLLPESDFEEARTRIEQADARVSAQEADSARGTGTVGQGASMAGSYNSASPAPNPRRARRRTARDLYRDDSDDDGYGGVLDSLIDVVKGQSSADRLRNELMDGSLQDIARNNRDVLSRLDESDARIEDAYREGLRNGRSANRDRRGYQDRYEDGRNLDALAPLEVEIPDQEGGIGENREVAQEGIIPAPNARGSGGTSQSGSGGAGGTGRIGNGATAVDDTDLEVESEEGELPQYEINQQTLRILDATLLRSNLRRRGIKPDEPFVMLVSGDRGQSVKLPVKPLTYLGQTIFVPVIMGENAGIVDVVEQSPLFADYRSYLNRR